MNKPAKRDEGEKQSMLHKSRDNTLVVTNLIKLGGLIAVMYEVFTNPHPDGLYIATFGFMMAGAQLSEDAIVGIVGKFFGGSSQTLESEPPQPKARQTPAKSTRSQGPRKKS